MAEEISFEDIVTPKEFGKDNQEIFNKPGCPSLDYLVRMDMNLEQIRAGLAWHYKKYQKEQTPSDRELYSKAEVEARKAKRGLWHDPEPVPPWEYRRR